MNSSLLIEVLHIPDCPHLPKTLQNLEKALQELEIKPKIKEIVIRNQEDADRLKFLGSTSIRINGEDINPRETNQYLLN